MRRPARSGSLQPTRIVKPATRRGTPRYEPRLLQGDGVRQLPLPGPLPPPEVALPARSTASSGRSATCLISGLLYGRFTPFESLSIDPPRSSVPGARRTAAAAASAASAAADHRQ